MDLREITEKQKDSYDKIVTHVIQSYEWGEFRERIGTKVLRYGIFEKGKLIVAFQITLHPIPFTNYFVGYLPKGPYPSKKLYEALQIIGKQYNCAFIKIEPNVTTTQAKGLKIDTHFKQSSKSLFTKFNFVIDLTKSEDQLMQHMHSKTRYNVRVAEKHGVTVEERTDDQALEIYSQLYFETTQRQKYHGHTPAYHKAVWETLKDKEMARFLISSFEEKPLTAWMLLNFKDTLYYPYGGSSKDHPEVMSNNLVAWEAIKLGKKLKLKSFDMWGAANNPNPEPSDPFYGFHRFKQGYGGELVEYIGTFDLVFNPVIYYLFTFIDKLMPLKLFLLKLIGK